MLDGLLGSKSTEGGILGDTSNYFGVVESNGRGMLHLHTLVWLQGNLGFTRLRDRILSDKYSAVRMITFLESVIVHSLHIRDEQGSAVSNTPPPSNGPETDLEFSRKLFNDSNHVAHIKQLHSKRHTATCFKYRAHNLHNNSCRFGMPRDLDVSKIDNHGIVHLARNHAWVNPWNSAIASCIRSNHDISWIPTVSKSPSLLYYITNNTTKDDMSPTQMVTKAALLKQAIEHANITNAPSTADHRLRQKSMDKFALRCFNSLSQGAPAPTNIFDNYKLRGQMLSHLSIFEYCMLVRTKRSQDATTEDLPFDDMHPRHRTHVQRLAHCPSQIATVTLQGELTEFQSAEDSIPGGNPLIAAIRNDLAEIFLGLVIPWQNLPLLFSQTPPGVAANHHLHHIWVSVEPTLPAYLRTFAENIELLRKSKSDCQVDASLRSRSEKTASPIGEDLTRPPYPESDSESDGTHFACPTDETTSNESLLTAFFAIGRNWLNDTYDAQRRIPNLGSLAVPFSSLRPDNLRPVQILSNPLYESTGLRFFSASTLQGWKVHLQNIKTPDQYMEFGTSAATASDFDGFNLCSVEDVLVPVLTNLDPSFDLQHCRSEVGQNPTGASLISLLRDIIPLNEKQRCVVEKVLSRLLSCISHPYSSGQREQSLIYVGGEGGAGKSQVIKAIVAAMDLMAPTGAAADIIGGSTYHTSLGISLNRYKRGGVSPRVRRLWYRKTVMVIDEVSMINLSELGIINTHCKIARSLDRSSPELFGGLPVVILMGDFHQFPPVQGQPLWKAPRNDTEQDGKLIWNQFQQVVILDEQMRQAEDVSYQNLLRRARSGTLTPDDLTMLDSKVITSLADTFYQNATAVVQSNSLRHVLNRFQIERFARARQQKIFIFPALHTRTRSAAPTDLQLRADDLLGLPEQGTRVPFPGFILYTSCMPAMVLTNVCTPVGLVNGATGQAVGVAVDPEVESPIQRYTIPYYLNKSMHDQPNSLK